MNRIVLALTAAALVLVAAPPALAQAPPFEYRLSFPSPEHRWMQVEARFGGLPPGTAEIRMSRTSRGRYALHEFAKNVYGVKATHLNGRPLPVTRSSPHEWVVTGHQGAVVFSYTLFADRADGTYAGVDETRAGHTQSSGMFSKGVPGGMPWSGSPAAGSYT